MLNIIILFSLMTLSFADEPIVHLSAVCPSTNRGSPTLRLTADVTAYAMARCRNGDMPFVVKDECTFLLDAFFHQAYKGSKCLFYKKVDVNTYTVDVEEGWGEVDTKIVQQRKIHTITCAYDAHGKAVSSTETIAPWFLNPWEAQTLLGGNSTSILSLKVLDVLDREVPTGDICIGRKIRLMSEDVSGSLGKGGSKLAFRALSCSAQNSQSRYYILRAGCSNGLVFPKTSGFQTVGNKVYSPYFEGFRLSGTDQTVTFQCRFTECTGACNGDSCSVEGNNPRPKRSIDDWRDPGLEYGGTAMDCTAMQLELHNGTAEDQDRVRLEEAEKRQLKENLVDAKNGLLLAQNEIGRQREKIARLTEEVNVLQIESRRKTQDLLKMDSRLMEMNYTEMRNTENLRKKWKKKIRKAETFPKCLIRSFCFTFSANLMNPIFFVDSTPFNTVDGTKS